jgi:hypothetical protein
VWLRRLVVGVCRRCRSRGETRADVGWGWAGRGRGLGMLVLQRAGTRLSAAVTRRGSLGQAGLRGELFFSACFCRGAQRASLCHRSVGSARDCYLLLAWYTGSM